MATESARAQADDLAEFGCKQELDRSIGKFASFAAGVSYISILTGTFQLFYFGFAFGGPAYWAILFIGIVFFGGLAYYWFVQRHKTGVLASHAFESSSPAVSEPAPEGAS